MIERAFPAPASKPVALLVDGENLSVDLAQTLIAEAQRFGVPTVRRAYGLATAVSRWHLAGFRPVQTHPGKNAADLLLCVEAMHLALRDAFHTIIIASSDRDFTYVQTHLRELGHCVIGMGEPKTPVEFRAACSAFVELVRIGAAVKPDRGTVSPSDTTELVMKPSAKASPPSAIAVKVEAWILQQIKASKHAAGLPIETLGQKLRKDLNVNAQVLGRASLGSYLRSRSDRFQCDPKGPNSRVRLIAAAKPRTLS